MVGLSPAERRFGNDLNQVGTSLREFIDETTRLFFEAENETRRSSWGCYSFELLVVETDMTRV